MMQLQHLPPHARLWLFLSDKALSETQEAQLSQLLTQFTDSWKSHGQPLSAGFAILHGHIVIIAVDQQVESPSGCSIDKAFRILQEFGGNHGLDFFHRLLIPLDMPEGISIVPRSQIAGMLTNGELSPQQPYFDLTIQSLDALRNNFRKPLTEGWALKGLSV